MGAGTGEKGAREAGEGEGKGGWKMGKKARALAVRCRANVAQYRARESPRENIDEYSVTRGERLPSLPRIVLVP